MVCFGKIKTKAVFTILLWLSANTLRFLTIEYLYGIKEALKYQYSAPFSLFKSYRDRNFMFYKRILTYVFMK